MKHKVKRYISVLMAVVLQMVFWRTSSSAMCLEYDAEKISVKNLGSYAYSVKMLNGLFFEIDGHVCLITGTETTEGATSQIIVYDVDRDIILNSYQVETACSFTAFTRGDDNKIYVGSISRTERDGCILFEYDAEENVFSNICYFQEKAIYSLYYSNSHLYVATSQPVSLYDFSIVNLESTLIGSNLTSQPYAFSVICENDTAYMAIGTEAAILRVNMLDGNVVNILPSNMQNDSSVGRLSKNL